MKNNRLAISAIDWLLLSMVIMGVLLVILSHRAKQNAEHIITTTDTVQIMDTIVDFQPQYVYVDHFDTTLLPVLISDTLTDTMLVMLPVEHYHYDSTIVDSNYTTHFSASLTGYKLSFDTLCLSTEIIENKPVPAPKKWYNRFAPSCGIGISTGGQIGLFFGIGYKIF